MNKVDVLYCIVSLLSSGSIILYVLLIRSSKRFLLIVSSCVSRYAGALSTIPE
jgi:hypothetical protein